MSARLLMISVIFISVAVCSIGRAQTPPSHSAVSGTIYDSTSGQPIPFATVQIVGTGRSTLANDDGQYRLLVSPGTYQLKFSHVSHYSLSLSLTVTDSVLRQDVYLRPSLIEVNGIRVFDKTYDLAQQIILDAIARKKQMLEKLHSYRFDAYLKVAVRNATKPESTNVMGIIESQMSAFWERPNKYKEIILARRQTANIPEGTVLTSLGDILDIYRDRNPFGNEEIVSPVAGDALDHYNYYLLDTIVVDGRRVLVLEIEPKRPEEPAYAGQIQIADSSYGVVGLEVKVQRALSEMGVKNIRFTQHFTEYQGEYWMPVEGRFWLNVNLNFPGLPSNIAVEAVTSFHNFTFDTAAPQGTFNQYALEVAPDADKVDSAAWDARQTIPLTAQESRDYRRMDSIVHNRPVGQKIAAGMSKVLFGALYSQDMFRFNRVEGAYAGLPLYFDHLIPRTSLRLKTGYAFDGKYWEHDYSFTTTLQHRPKLEIGGGFHDRIVSRPTIITSGFTNNTLWALIDQWDPLDYYLEKGFYLSVLANPVSHFQTSLTYNDFDQYSAAVHTNYRLFQSPKVPALNPAIVNGKLRSMSAGIYYDSRPLILNKGEEMQGFAEQYTLFSAGIQYASPKMLKSDFDFRRYSISLDRRQRIFGLGTSTLFFYWGASDRALPPQEYFTVDYSGDLFLNRKGFSTLGRNNFSGSQATVVTLRHNFGRRLFYRSGLPLIKSLPFDLSVFGGAFWTDFRNHPSMVEDDSVRVARRAYSEVGFRVANLTPFLSPFNFGVDFNWQLSSYNTNRSTVTLRLGL